MPRSKKCKNRSFPERRNSRSFLSKLLSVFRCSGKNSVRVQPTHISVRPATATMDVRAGSQTPLVFFSSSRPSTAIRPTTSTKVSLYAFVIHSRVVIQIAILQANVPV